MKRRIFAVMTLCFLFGGYFILSFISQSYVLLLPSPAQPDFINNSDFPDNQSEFPPFLSSQRRPQVFSPFSIVDLLGGIMFLIAGATMGSILREKEIAILKDGFTNALLMPEEKQVLNELKELKGESTQRELVKKTGMTKVKMHRTLNKLEAKKIIERHPYGNTKKIVLKNSI
jgi:uncharacterized membrane protein